MKKFNDHRKDVSKAVEKQNTKIAFTIGALAILLALNVFLADLSAHNALEAMGDANDHWAWYQSKSIKGYIYETQAEALELKITEGGLDVECGQSYRETIDRYEEKIATYEGEKAEISANAEAFEEENDRWNKRYIQYSMALILAEIGILLCSAAIINKDRRFWFIAIVLGLIAIGEMLFGLLVV